MFGACASTPSSRYLEPEGRHSMTAIGVTPKDDRELEEKDNAVEAEEETEEDLDQEQVDEDAEEYAC